MLNAKMEEGGGAGRETRTFSKLCTAKVPPETESSQASRAILREGLGEPSNFVQRCEEGEILQEIGGGGGQYAVEKASETHLVLHAVNPTSCVSNREVCCNIEQGRGWGRSGMRKQEQEQEMREEDAKEVEEGGAAGYCSSSSSSNNDSCKQRRRRRRQPPGRWERSG